MPENTSRERRELLAIGAAQDIGSPAAGGSNTAVRIARPRRRAPRLVIALPVGNPDNTGAHYATTGPEILTDLSHHHFVADWVRRAP